MAKLIEIDSIIRDRDIQDYRKFNIKRYNSILSTAKKLKGLTIVHINATPYGGGVAELLKSEVTLERSIGLRSMWLTISAPNDFFVTTKKIHNLLQGKSGSLTEKEKSAYFSTSKELGESLNKILSKIDPGIVVIHDPQPLLLVDFIPEKFRTVCRMHVDLSTSDPSTLDLLRPFIEKFDSVVISNEDYKTTFPWLKKSKLKIIYPAIDPLSLKNQPMTYEAAVKILENSGINCSYPIIAQISRFDPWKDPFGVILSYYIAKNEIPNLKLILVGFFAAQDDPEAISVFEHVQKHSYGDPDIHLFSDFSQLGALGNDAFISAIYTASTVIIQKSLREGFGLTMTEAMWKKKGLVAGKTSGSMLQIQNNKNGILISSPQEAAKAIVKLINDEKLRKRLGKAAHESVKKNFLIPRFILDNLKLYQSLIKR